MRRPHCGIVELDLRPLAILLEDLERCADGGDTQRNVGSRLDVDRCRGDDGCGGALGEGGNEMSSVTRPRAMVLVNVFMGSTLLRVEGVGRSSLRRGGDRSGPGIGSELGLEPRFSMLADARGGVEDQCPT